MRAATDDLRREVRATEQIISVTSRRAQDDHDEAGEIDVALVRIQALRTSIATTARDLQSARSSESEQRGVLDHLLACRDALDDAARNLRLRPANSSAATIALRRGTSECTVALDLANGATGAVHPYDFADPSVLHVGGVYYAFGTNGPTGQVQVLSSTDLDAWRVRSTAIERLANWARAGSTWAPSVHHIGTTFVLYYAVTEASSGKQCISVATSSTPGGPYADRTTAPLVCQRGLGGSIDPDMYVDDHGFMHLTWKSEGTASGRPAQLWSQYLNGDGTALLATPSLLLSATEPWQDRIIENPSMTRVGSTWLLLYSANRWDTDRYRTAYATCATENGPCTTAADPVVLSTTAKVAGPGGAQVFRSGGGDLLVAYAAWDAGDVGYPNVRRLHIARLTFVGGRPSVSDR